MLACAGVWGLRKMDKSHEIRTGGECQETLAKLYTFLDGELTQERKNKIRHHLDECSPCLEAYEFESELRAMVASKSRDHCPDALRAKIAEILKLSDTVQE